MSTFLPELLLDLKDRQRMWTIPTAGPSGTRALGSLPALHRWPEPDESDSLLSDALVHAPCSPAKSTLARTSSRPCTPLQHAAPMAARADRPRLPGSVPRFRWPIRITHQGKSQRPHRFASSLCIPETADASHDPTSILHVRVCVPEPCSACRGRSESRQWCGGAQIIIRAHHPPDVTSRCYTIFLILRLRNRNFKVQK